MPTLEITADNIECSHGASVADLDENSMFYLAARGISRQVADLYSLALSLCFSIVSFLYYPFLQFYFIVGGEEASAARICLRSVTRFEFGNNHFFFGALSAKLI